MTVDPQLAVGDGALDFWKAFPRVSGETRTQRGWVHQTANLLNQLPQRLQPKAKSDLPAIQMAAPAKLSDRTGIQVDFADPHSPWPRGINENTNGLLRQYLPKGADFSVLSQRDLDDIAFDLNVRPRKFLGWKCSLELFMPESFNYESYFRTHVALQT